MTPLILTLTIAAGAVGALLRYVVQVAPGPRRRAATAGGQRPRAATGDATAAAAMPAATAATAATATTAATAPTAEIAAAASTAPAVRRGIRPDWRIVIVNVVASFLGGAAFAMLPATWEPVAIAGLCGGLSTWSTFMTETYGAWRVGRRWRALALLAATIGYGLLAALAGLWLGRELVAA
ncbi:MAG: fluoride efflux transporter FluC [Pseudoclavibacter sp.]